MPLSKKTLMPARAEALSLADDLARFSDFATRTEIGSTGSVDRPVPIFINEFWTSRQRAASRLHEVSYRACFKPQLPRFFIERLTAPGDVVFDPFMGRGTTLLEAALLGRIPMGTDASPLCRRLITPRLTPPTLNEVCERLDQIDFERETDQPTDLLVFYHPTTLRQICALRAYLSEKENPDPLDDWIQMVALNRLAGHSKGFFSVYTLPPNQAVSVASQKKINQRLEQTPDFRDVPKLILSKTKSLLSDLTDANRLALKQVRGQAKILTGPSDQVSAIADASVTLVVTSPPFLDVVDYAGDNWLRSWFIDFDPRSVKMSVYKNLAVWEASMRETFRELARVLRPGGWVAFEVGEVRRGRIKLEQTVIPAGADAGLVPELVLINSQHFTKTANCWGVKNNNLGTNTNRVVVFRKDAA